MLTILFMLMSAAEQSIYTPRPKKLSCEICGKIFETPDMLQYHKSVEHGEGRRPPFGVS